MTGSIRRWWRRAGGGREVLHVALPLVISSLSWTVMTFVDRVFLNWVSGSAMNAAFTASMVWFSFLCLPLGLCSYANSFVAQYYGDQQLKQIGPSVWQAIWVAVGFSAAVPMLIYLADPIFRLAGHSSEVTPLEVTYFQTLCPGMIGMLVAQAASAFYSGRGRTMVVMWVDSAFALLNVVLDYLLIFGGLGITALGIAGAGYATSLSLTLKAITYVLLMLRREHRTQFATWAGIKIDWKLMRRLFYFGFPSGVQMLLDLIGFTAFVVMVGRLGALQFDATTMAFSISTLAFMPIWGFGMTASILVGQRLGENDPDLAARSTWTAATLALGYMLVISALYILAPEIFLFGFFAGVPSDSHAGTDVAATRNLAVTLLRFVAFYNLFDAVLVVFSNAIKGAGDTRFLLYISLVMGALLAGASYIAVEVLQIGLLGCWTLLAGWVLCVGLIFLSRFLQGRWRNMRVIEQKTR